MEVRFFIRVQSLARFIILILSRCAFVQLIDIVQRPLGRLGVHAGEDGCQGLRHNNECGVSGNRRAKARQLGCGASPPSRGALNSLFPRRCRIVKFVRNTLCIANRSSNDCAIKLNLCVMYFWHILRRGAVNAGLTYSGMRSKAARMGKITHMQH